MSEFPGAIDYFVSRGRVFPNQNDHSAIVAHGTGGNPAQTVEQLGDYFRSTPLMTSVHYGIGRDGRIAQYVLESDGAAGNCCKGIGYDPFWDQFGEDNLNLHTLSFETENDSSNSLPLSDLQKDTAFQLCNYWVHKYGIPLENIKSHASIDPVNRSRCPGPNFPWDELMNYLKGVNQPMKPNTNQQKAADLEWDSVLKSLPVGPAQKGTGIYGVWLDSYIQGRFYGPPLSHEYDSVDWNGNPIVVQQFAHARCEWGSTAGLLGWYKID